MKKMVVVLNSRYKQNLNKKGKVIIVTLFGFVMNNFYIFVKLQDH